MCLVPTHANGPGLRREIHELANQLFVIQGFSGLLGRTVPQDHAAVRYALEIDRAILRASDSVERLRLLAVELEQASAGSEGDDEVVRGDAREEERIDPVENAAVPPE